MAGRKLERIELKAIIADYFVMLGDELAKGPYVKAHHLQALMQMMGRSAGATGTDPWAIRQLRGFHAQGMLAFEARQLIMVDGCDIVLSLRNAIDLHKVI